MHRLIGFIGHSGLAALAAIFGIMALPATGSAAPQALALVKTQGATELVCRNGSCGAEFSSFCLQRGRNSPDRGTAYRLEGDGAIQVVGRTSDGEAVTLDPAAVLRFESLRTHVAVRISVPRATMRQHRLETVSVEIGEAVTLAPEAVAGDANPQDDVSLATASGPLRALGDRIVDTDPTRMDAARLTSRLINKLEATPLRSGDVAKDLWGRVVGKAPPVSDEAQRLARGALNMCNFVVERRNYSDVRNCLQHHHDRFVVFLNGRYWDASGAGM